MPDVPVAAKVPDCSNHASLSDRRADCSVVDTRQRLWLSEFGVRNRQPVPREAPHAVQGQTQAVMVRTSDILTRGQAALWRAGLVTTRYDPAQCDGRGAAARRRRALARRGIATSHLPARLPDGEPLILMP